ncbi:hypothetical protein FY134_10185 [Agrobacterium fabrum]|uniref:hypothetical protein n=1 Tax=Agrobacterium fabrum TaxID=1176649 RepID=UPI0013A6DE4B|nr:hypothetical protein [Agrobacterium fabrum]UXT57995.1 hypothetical protein FY134_10185 [Agrobacterium fabrum]
MGRSKPIASVFIDTNIFKFSAVKKHVLRPAKKTASWGGATFETVIHEPYTVNEINKIKSDGQRRDALLLSMLAYAGISDLLSFHIHHEVDLETWGLPGMASPSGQFFGCPIDWVPDPVVRPHRVILGGGKKFKQHSLDFVSGIDHPRYKELSKVTGAFQGNDKPLNLNQALDAYHIWCAEVAQMDYFLTMDYKLKKVVERSKIKTSVTITTPEQLLMQVVPKFGVVGAFRFMWKGYRFAKTHVGFGEGLGWT